ncbi:MAG: pilus assembly protein [Deltaproteobacteria bacterium]|nr:pilus assembly protein [Deltaproteobacteria bacterium]
MVEFAIVLPLLLMLVFGIIEFGLVLFDQAMITNASREGARAGIVFADPRITTEQISTVVQNYTAGNMITFGAAANPTTTVTGACANSGDPLTVNVSYPYSFLVLPNFVSSLSDTLNLSAQTIMRCE